MPRILVFHNAPEILERIDMYKTKPFPTYMHKSPLHNVNSLHRLMAREHKQKPRLKCHVTIKHAITLFFFAFTYNKSTKNSLCKKVQWCPQHTDRFVINVWCFKLKLCMRQTTVQRPSVSIRCLLSVFLVQCITLSFSGYQKLPNFTVISGYFNSQQCLC